ncbi:hypothetical protein JZO70_21080 [Enterococcus sp. 669A]|uniref:Uncharacterized protein n=1 Tax=Candidatus Enterococcus moelleringii TaxID=2815325 RepID=A0ABS3LGC0_9ENTE|nr:hypothetical protein [Enterococcus sp. 669A]MBO1308681.1 hypothetical protein [Enterococcus sp. 669A]
MTDKEMVVSESGAQLLAESKFKPFIPGQRQENNKKQLVELFSKSSAANIEKETVKK